MTFRTRDATASIPAEVLLEIFNLVSVDHVELNSTSAPTEENSPVNKHVRWLEPADFDFWKRPKAMDMGDPKLFPYCLADVCKRWRDITQTCPEWWSRFRVLMDQGSPKAILADVRHNIELTQRVQTLQIFVGNSSKEYEADPKVEHNLIANILKIIQPHLARFEKIIIHAKHGGSLPLISGGAFSGPTPVLRELQLDCDSYPVVQSLRKAGLKTIRLPPQVTPRTKQFPVRLTLGGPTFLDACRKPAFFTALFSGTSDISLKISHVKTNNSIDTYSFFKALCRKDINSITLDHVEVSRNSLMDNLLQDVPGLANMINHLQNIPPKLTLISTDPSLIRPCYGDHVLDCLTIDNCPTTGMEYPQAHELIIKNIAGEEDIAEAIISVNPENLHIENCPNLDDFALGVLGHPRGGGVCHCLRTFDIESGRTKITLAGLKRFIEGRRVIAEKYYTSKGKTNYPTFMEFDDYFFPDFPSDPTPLQQFCIHDAGFNISDEERKSLEQSILSFSWSAEPNRFDYCRFF